MARCVVVAGQRVACGGIGPMDGLSHLGEDTDQFVAGEARWECGIRAEHTPITARAGWPDKEHRAPTAVRTIDEVAVDPEPIDIDNESGERAVAGEAGERLLDTHTRHEFDRECTGGGPTL
jgi:hypothetical protein